MIVLLKTTCHVAELNMIFRDQGLWRKLLINHEFQLSFYQNAQFKQTLLLWWFQKCPHPQHQGVWLTDRCFTFHASLHAQFLWRWWMLLKSAGTESSGHRWGESHGMSVLKGRRGTARCYSWTVKGRASCCYSHIVMQDAAACRSDLGTAGTCYHSSEATTSPCH